MITIFCDGLCEPNPNGYATCAFIAFEGETKTGSGAKVIHRQFGCIKHPGENATNNEAEYRAVRAAMRWAHKRDKSAKYTIKTDSRLVVMQVAGNWNCNSENLQFLQSECHRLFCELVKTELEWIPREENFKADELTRIAYRQARGQKAA